MSDAKLPAAKRRLATFMADPERGAQLARLNRRDERVILDLIYENKGAEARRRLTELDTARRSRRSTADRVRKYRALSRQQRHDQHPENESAEFWALYGPDASGPLE